jgi:hypothetical protein
MVPYRATMERAVGRGPTRRLRAVSVALLCAGALSVLVAATQPAATIAGNVAPPAVPDASRVLGAALSVRIAGPPALLLGEVAQFSASASGGAAPYNFGWTVNQTNVAGGSNTTLVYRPLADGVDRVTVQARDAAGREANASIDLLVTGSGPVSVRLVYRGPAADGGAELLAQASGGTPPYRFLWLGMGAGSAWTSAANWTTPPLPAGAFTYRVSALDQRGYRAQSVPLTVESSPRTVTESSGGLWALAIGLGVAVGAAGVALLVVTLRRRRRRTAARP